MRKKILLVEDEVLIALAEERIIKGFGYDVISAYHGEEAVDLALTDPLIDLVLMDIDLGCGMSGPEAAQKILAERHIPIVFLTSHAERETVEKVRGITRYGYVIKNSGNFVLQSSIEMAFELHEVNENLRMQHDLSLTLDSCQDLNQGLETVLKEVMRFESIDCGGIYIADPVSGGLDLVVYHGLSQEFIRRVSHFEPESPNVILVGSGEVRYTMYNEIRPHPDDIRLKEGLRAIALIPIMSQGQLIAVINIASHTHDSIPQGTRIMLETVASNVGSALMRLRSETALRENLLFQQTLMDNFPVGVVIIDPATRIIEKVNNAAIAMFGASGEDITGHLCHRFLCPAVENECPICDLGQAVDNAEREIICSDRSTRPVMKSVKKIVLDKQEKLLECFIDITDRKKAESSLRESEERFALALQGANDGIWDWDLVTNRVVYSHQWKAMLGYADEEIINQLSEWERLVHPDDRQRVLDEVNGFINGKTPNLVIEMRMLHRDGRWIDVLSRGYLVRDRKNAAVRLIGTHVDITDRKRAEHELIAVKSRLEGILDAVPDLMFEVGLSGRFYSFFSHNTELLAASVNEFIGKKVSGVLPPEAAAVAMEALNEANEKGVSNGKQYELVLPKGRLWFELSISRKKADGDEEPRFICLARDITTRKTAELSLLESEVRFRRVSAITSDIAYSCTTGECGAFVIDWMTGAAEMITGYTIDEIKSRNCWRFLVIEEDQGLFEKKVIGLAPGQNGFCELRIRRKDGDIVWVASNAECVSGPSGECMLYGGLKDIAGRKMAEEKIAGLLAEKELLLREVHHRIKNYMNMAGSLLSMHSEKVKNTEAAAALQDARCRLQGMEVLYDRLYRSENLLAMSARDYLQSLVEQLVSLFPGSAAVKVEIRIDDFILGVGLLSPLGIIVNELVTNAMKHAFHGRNGGMLSVSGSLRDGIATVAVADNGTGLSESAQAGSPGSFGLQLVEGLVRQIGGTMAIECKNGTKIVLQFRV